MKHPGPRLIVKELADADKAAASVRKQRDREIVRLARLGVSASKLALEYGLTRERVRQIVAREGRR